MKKKHLIVALIAISFTSPVFAQNIYDPARMHEAAEAADQGIRLAQSMHEDTHHNFGGHMEKARQYFEEAKSELAQADHFAAMHGERPGGGN